MLKVGLFTDTYFPQVNGVATSTATLKRNLEKLGHDVYVFTTTNPMAQKEEAHIYRVPSVPVVSEHRLAMFYKGHLAAEIESLNLDIIHTHTEFSLGIFGRLIAKKLKLPLIHTYHTIYEDYTHYLIKSKKFDFLSKDIVRKLSKSFCNTADKLIVPTGKVKYLLQSYGVVKEMSVIPTGVAVHKFAAWNGCSSQNQAQRNRLGISENTKVILYIGRISKEKNIETLFVYLQSYVKEKTDVKFVLVGNGPEKNNLEALAKQLDMTAHVLFVGGVPWDSVRNYYWIGDVFVSASQSETQGLTYIEALASGLPVVAKADACLEGVVENHVNGYTFEHKEGFLRALDAILDDRKHQETLSMGAVHSAQKFSEVTFSENVERLYLETLSMKQTRKGEGAVHESKVVFRERRGN